MSGRAITNKCSKFKKLRSAPTQYPQAAGPAKRTETVQLSSAMQAAESSPARCVSYTAAQSFVNLISREEVPVETAGRRRKGFLN